MPPLFIEDVPAPRTAGEFFRLSAAQIPRPVPRPSLMATMPATASRWRAGGGCVFGLRPWVLGFLALSVTLICGCHLPSRDGPVPRSLATCRQLSQQGVSAEEREDWASAETLFNQAVQT